MSIDAELQLPPDVEIFAVRELAPQVREKIQATDEDYAITRRHSRGASRIIDRESANLLGVFRTPTRIVDAVLSFAGSHGLDPEATLEQAYPLLYQLYQAKLLVPPDGPTAIERELELGSSIEGFRLLRCIQFLDDNEVFLGRDAAGQYAAVKFYRKADERIVQMLEHEADMMRRTKNRRAPEVYSLAPVGSGMVLITEWIFGSEATKAASLRRLRETRSQYSLLTLCQEVAAAFAEVHESGVLHGDVHPRNVMVESRGSVRLIDFGLAQAVEEAQEHAIRGGVAFYFDPEFAEAQRTHTTAILSAAGEQYSVASLLYQLCTGVYYVDWSLERDELLRQIVEDGPVAFEARDIPAWPALEAILQRALQKRPEARFPSMRALSDALHLLSPEAEVRDRKATRRHKERPYEKDLLDRALGRYAPGGDALRHGLDGAPFASINYGAGGIAYAMYRIALARGDAELLATADIWTQRAFALSSHENAFYNTALEIDLDTVGEASLFHSISGLHCVRALVSIAMGDANAAIQAVQSFVSSSHRVCPSFDLTLGKASLLLGCCELIESIPVPWFINLSAVRARGEEIAAELTALLQSQQIATSTAVTMLGIAHGWGGLAFALMRWAKATGQKPDPVVEASLDELAALAEPHGAGIRWPVHNTDKAPTYMEGWCNGAAGHALLFAMAEKTFANGRFGDPAERAAISAWTSETQFGTLCCGLGGIGYALLAIYRLTGSELWLERARSTARRAAADHSKYFLRDSLYKGTVGVALLAEEIRQPELAAMPLFEGR